MEKENIMDNFAINYGHLSICLHYKHLFDLVSIANNDFSSQKYNICQTRNNSFAIDGFPMIKTDELSLNNLSL